MARKDSTATNLAPSAEVATPFHHSLGALEEFQVIPEFVEM
jgi:hypothetical protein